MKFLREHIAFKILWLAMALLIFNCSVDTPDPQSENVPEDLSYNDMESVVEIVLEEVLDIENAIAEHDDTDTGEGSGFEIKKGVDFSYHQSNNKILFCNNSTTVCKHSHYKESYYNQFYPELTPPPPKA